MIEQDESKKFIESKLIDNSTDEVSLREMHALLGNIKERFAIYLPHIDQYWLENRVPYEDDTSPLPPFYHGTRMSALTGIRLNGLIPIPEHERPIAAVYATVNPHSAGAHIFYTSNFDTYDKPSPTRAKLNENDPPVILKIDTQKYYEEWVIPNKTTIIDQLKYILKGVQIPREVLPHNVVKLMRYHQQNYHFHIHEHGLPISLDTIPVQYIKVLAFGILDRKQNGEVEEITLDQAYERLLAHDVTV